MDYFSDWAILLAALYAPGTPHGVALNRRKWCEVAGTLRSSGTGIDGAARKLGGAGLVAESLALTAPGCLVWAEEHHQAGLLLTAIDEQYPERWLSSLREFAPPTLWRRGSSCTLSKGWIGVVGSRDVTPQVQVFCAEIARKIITEEHGLVSGGASGCDQAARRAALGVGGPVLTLVPFGIELVEEVGDGECVLSLCAPRETFSTGRAMERNGLIYAASQLAIVGHSRFKQGGTWHGATDAIRRGLCPVAIRKDRTEPGHRALASLGAREMDSPEDLAHLLDSREDRNSLFAGLRVG